jgi:HEAT repeat protein
VDSQNSLFISGKQPDNNVIAACFQALGKLGDPSSFPVLFSAMYLGYSDAVAGIAHDALLALKGDLTEMLRGVIKDRPLAEKKLALQMAIDSDKLSDDQKAKLAQFALDIGLHSSVSDAASKGVLRDIRFQAAAALGARKWSDATGLLIEHLDMAIGEFDKGLVDRNHLVDAITNLGAMNTHDAAVRLTQYLVLLNSYAEKGKVFDDQVVFTVLQNLGALGDKVAFDDLMYTQYLNYSAGVKKAARAALDKLKW